MVCDGGWAWARFFLRLCHSDVEHTQFCHLFSSNLLSTNHHKYTKATALNSKAKKIRYFFLFLILHENACTVNNSVWKVSYNNVTAVGLPKITRTNRKKNARIKWKRNQQMLWTILCTLKNW